MGSLNKLRFPMIPIIYETLLSNLKVMVKPNLPQRTKTEDDPHEQSIEARHTSKPWDLCCETSKIPLRQQGGPLLDINGVMGMLWGPYKWPYKWVTGFSSTPIHGVIGPYLYLVGTHLEQTPKKHWRTWNPKERSVQIVIWIAQCPRCLSLSCPAEKKTFEARVGYSVGVLETSHI